MQEFAKLGSCLEFHIFKVKYFHSINNSANFNVCIVYSKFINIKIPKYMVATLGPMRIITQDSQACVQEMKKKNCHCFYHTSARRGW